MRRRSRRSAGQDGCCTSNTLEDGGSSAASSWSWLEPWGSPRAATVYFGRPCSTRSRDACGRGVGRTGGRCGLKWEAIVMFHAAGDGLELEELLKKHPSVSATGYRKGEPA